MTAALPDAHLDERHTRTPHSGPNGGSGVGSDLGADPSPSGADALSHNDRTWLAKFAAVEAWVAEHGALPVQRDVTEDGFRIGQWLDTQRRSYRRGDLPEWRAVLLSCFPGFDWGTTAARPRFEIDWEDAFEIVAATMARTGRMPVATAIIQTPNGSFAIGAWCHRQKTAHTHGLLSEDRAMRLDQIPYWEWAQPRLGWLNTYDLLKAWVAEHGHLPDPDVVVPIPLGDLPAGTGPVAVQIGAVDPAQYEETFGVGQVEIRLGHWVQLQRFHRGRLGRAGPRTRRREYPAVSGEVVWRGGGGRPGYVPCSHGGCQKKARNVGNWDLSAALLSGDHTCCGYAKHSAEHAIRERNLKEAAAVAAHAARPAGSASPVSVVVRVVLRRLSARGRR